MTQLYLNSSLDYLILNGASDWLMVLDETIITPQTPGTFPATPAPMSISITSFAPSFVSVTHGLRRQVRSRGAHAWQMDLRYGGMTRATFAPLWAFLVGRGGQYGTFTVNLPGLINQGAGGGTPRVNGASQTGTSLITDGWPATTAILKAGDWLQVENDAKVYQVMADVTSSGGGAATISIFPSLRVTPSDNFAVATSVIFTMALSQDTLAVDWSQCVMPVNFEISLVEVL